SLSRSPLPLRETERQDRPRVRSPCRLTSTTPQKILLTTSDALVIGYPRIPLVDCGRCPVVQTCPLGDCHSPRRVFRQHRKLLGNRHQSFSGEAQTGGAC